MDSTCTHSSLLEHNISLLRRRQPEIVEELICGFSSLATAVGKVSLLESKTGNLTIKYGDNLLHSLYDPLKEAQRFTQGLDLNPHINVAVLGLGLGYHLHELVGMSSKRDFILVVEKSMEIFKAYLENRDLSDLYKVCNVYFAVGRSPMDIFRSLQGCSLTIFANGITVIKHPASSKIDPLYYETVGEKIRDIFQWARVNTVSQINASHDFADNIFHNMPAYLRIPGIKTLAGKFSGLPAIVVSAGPSLIKNIRYLKEVGGKAVIISVDTALRVLLKHGIEPDLVVSIDYTKHNDRYFQGIPRLNTALVIDPEVYPDIIDGYEGPKFMISLPGKSLCDWLESNVEDKGGMDKGLSVAHTAFLLAVRLGLSPVGFVGQDLSFPGKMTHVRGSAMVRRSQVSLSQKDTTLVKDIFGADVVTTTSMEVFLRHFEELFDKHNTRCYDLTEGGALIAGAPPIPLKEFIIRETKDVVDIKKIIMDAYNRPVQCDYNRLRRALKNTVAGLNTVLEISENGKKVVKDLKRRIKYNNHDFKTISKLFMKWADVSKKLHSQRDVFMLLGNNITDVLLLQAKKDSFSLDKLDKHNLKEALELLDKDQTVFCRLAGQCRIFIDNFTQFEQRIPDIK